MKNRCFMVVVIFLATALLLTGCATIKDTFFNKASTSSEKKLDKKADELKVKEDALGDNNKTKLKQIGTLSKGVDHALDKEKDPSKPINVAKELNDRVASLAGNPDVKDVVRIKQIVDELISEVEKDRLRGKLELSRLDAELQYSQTQRTLIQKDLDKKTDEYKDLSDKIAKESDKSGAIVNAMDSWFGLGAVFYGAKKFLASAATILVVAIILFLILRVLSQTNPIAAAVFSIFEMLASGLLHIIKWVIPNSFSFAKFVDKDISDKQLGTLDKIVDTIQSLKDANKELEDDKKIYLERLFEELDKHLDDSHKKVINERLRAMNWKV